MRKLPPIYLITDRKQITPGLTFLEVLEELLQAGVGMLQLREKDLTAAKLLPLAHEVRALTRRYDCLLLINDRIDIAQLIDADGIHLGRHSIPADAARTLFGPEAIIGVSTHTEQEVHTAKRCGADFITFGPVFPTASKLMYGPPPGLDELEKTCRSCPLPVYGLGGINAENAPQVMQSGAHGVALISTLIASSAPTDSFNRLESSLNF